MKKFMSYYSPISIGGALIAFLLSFIAWQNPIIEKIVNVLFYNTCIWTIVIVFRVLFSKAKTKT